MEDGLYGSGGARDHAFDIDKILCIALRLQVKGNRPCMPICAVAAASKCHRSVHTARHCGNADAGSLTCHFERLVKTPMSSCVP